MADAKTVVQLVNASFETPEPAEELRGRLMTERAAELIQIEDTRGEKHFVNAAHIVEIREHGSRSMTVH